HAADAIETGAVAPTDGLPRLADGAGLVHGAEEAQVVGTHQENAVAEDPDLVARCEVGGGEAWEAPVFRESVGATRRPMPGAPGPGGSPRPSPRGWPRRRCAPARRCRRGDRSLSRPRHSAP